MAGFNPVSLPPGLNRAPDQAQTSPALSSDSVLGQGVRMIWTSEHADRGEHPPVSLCVPQPTLSGALAALANAAQ